MNCLRNKKRGFTLIEGLVAAIILVLALIPVVDVMRKSFEEQKATINTLLAVNLAIGELNRLKNMSFESMKSEPDTFESDPFSATLNFDFHPQTPPLSSEKKWYGEVVEITVKIEWAEERSGRARSLKMSTLVANK
ncbi:MAG: type II secretion system protein [bacterium]|nr:type II secretion system protein [bacterium]